MILSGQVRRLMKELGNGTPLCVAATLSGMTASLLLLRHGLKCDSLPGRSAECHRPWNPGCRSAGGRMCVTLRAETSSPPLNRAVRELRRRPGREPTNGGIGGQSARMADRPARGSARGSSGRPPGSMRFPERTLVSLLVRHESPLSDHSTFPFPVSKKTGGASRPSAR